MQLRAAIWLAIGCAALALAPAARAQFAPAPPPAGYEHRPVFEAPPATMIPYEAFPAATIEGGLLELSPPGYDPLWDADAYVLPAPPKLEPYKRGFFQKWDFEATWINRPTFADYGVYSLETYLTTALPAPTPESPLLITPGFGVHWIDGPPHLYLAPRVYDAYLNVTWVRPLGDRWKALLSVSPGAYGDFETGGSDLLRIKGRGIATFDWTPDYLQLVLGVLYLDNDDINILPVGGLIWTPTSGQRYELIYPQPKAWFRIGWGRGPGPLGAWEDWLTLGAEFLNEQYLVETAAGGKDQLLLRDYRLVLGLERKRDGGAGRRIEIAYVLGRELEFISGARGVDGGGTVMIRGGVSF